jgi:chromosome segregation ATPase
MRRILLAVSLAVAIAGIAQAQTARSDGGGNSQLMQQMQQMASERTALQAENARLKRELDETRKDRDSLKSERETSQRRMQNAEGAAARAGADRTRLEEDLEQQKQRMAELIAKFRETVGNLREAESQRADASRQLDARNLELKTCVDRNGQLYSLSGEILDKLDSQGFWSSVGKVEPFTRLKRTQLENLADEYRGRAEDARIGAPPTAASGAPDQPPGS